MEMSILAWLRERRTLSLAASGILRFAGGLAALLLLFAAWHGGFRLRTAWGMVEVPGFDTLFWTCVVLTAVAGLSRVTAGSVSSAEIKEPPPPLSRAGVAGLLIVLILAHAGLWIRSCYLSYHEHLFDQSAPVVPPLWMSGVLYGVTALCSAAVWVATRRRNGDFGASAAVVLMALSPLMFYVSVGVAAAYAGALITWGIGACLCVLTARFRVWGPWHLALVVVLAGTLVLHFGGYGWAGDRVARQIAERMVPVPGILMLVACGLWRVWRGRLWRTPAVGGALMAAALGVALSGVHQPQGDIGVVWMLPLTTVLAGCGAAQLLTAGRLLAGVYGRNMALVLTLALLLAAVRAGMPRSVVSPLETHDESREVEDWAIEQGEEK